MSTTVDSIVTLSIKSDANLAPPVLRHQLQRDLASEIVPTMSLDHINNLERLQFFQQRTASTMCRKVLATEFFRDIVSLAWSVSLAPMLCLMQLTVGSDRISCMQFWRLQRHTATI